jgi:vacuolar-type H+-ATPase subunit H
MGPNIAPLLIGLAAMGAALVVVGAVIAVRRLFQRIRLRPRRDTTHASDGWLADHEWPTPSQGTGDPGAAEAARSAPTSSQPQPFADRREGATVDVAERRAEAILHAAMQEADRLLREGRLEAEREAQDTLAAAEARGESLLRESEAEGDRRARAIIESAMTQARDLVDKANQAAGGIMADAHRERARLVDDLRRERARVEETRSRLSTFLVDVLDEVHTPRSARPATNVRDISEAREGRTTAAGDL